MTLCDCALKDMNRIVGVSISPYMAIRLHMSTLDGYKWSCGCVSFGLYVNEHGIESRVGVP